MRLIRRADLDRVAPGSDTLVGRVARRVGRRRRGGGRAAVESCDALVPLVHVSADSDVDAERLDPAARLTLVGDTEHQEVPRVLIGVLDDGANICLGRGHRFRVIVPRGREAVLNLDVEDGHESGQAGHGLRRVLVRDRLGEDLVGPLLRRDSLELLEQSGVELHQFRLVLHQCHAHHRRLFGLRADGRVDAVASRRQGRDVDRIAGVAGRGLAGVDLVGDVGQHDLVSNGREAELRRQSDAVDTRGVADECFDVVGHVAVLGVVCNIRAVSLGLRLQRGHDRVELLFVADRVLVQTPHGDKRVVLAGSGIGFGRGLDGLVRSLGVVSAQGGDDVGVTEVDSRRTGVEIGGATPCEQENGHHGCSKSCQNALHERTSLVVGAALARRGVGQGQLDEGGLERRDDREGHERQDAEPDAQPVDLEQRHECRAQCEERDGHDDEHPLVSTALPETVDEVDGRSDDRQRTDESQERNDSSEEEAERCAELLTAERELPLVARRQPDRVDQDDADEVEEQNDPEGGPEDAGAAVDEQRHLREGLGGDGGGHGELLWLIPGCLRGLRIVECVFRSCFLGEFRSSASIRISELARCFG